jgi:hypothetical protein
VSSLFAKKTSKPRPAYDYSKVPERTNKRKTEDDSDEEVLQVRGQRRIDFI